MRVRISSVSTYSATVVSDMARASCAIACTIDSARGSLSTSRTKLPSILSMPIGSVRRYASELRPVPKSSSAILQPRLRSRRISTSGRFRLPMAALSVSSKHSIAGSRPLLSIMRATCSVKSASCSDWPEKLIANTIWLARSSSACGWSISSACLITQRHDELRVEYQPVLRDRGAQVGDQINVGEAAHDALVRLLIQLDAIAAAVVGGLAGGLGSGEGMHEFLRARIDGGHADADRDLHLAVAEYGAQILGTGAQRLGELGGILQRRGQQDREAVA